MRSVSDTNVLAASTDTSTDSASAVGEKSVVLRLVESQDHSAHDAIELTRREYDANRYFVNHLRTLEPGSALVLAAGDGHEAAWLAAHGWSVRAVDFSEEKSRILKRMCALQKVEGMIEYEVASITNFREPTPRFDLVVLAYPDLSIPDLIPIIEAAARAVGSGGTLMLIANIAAKITADYGSSKNPDVLYTAARLLAAMGGDLEIEKVYRFE